MFCFHNLRKINLTNPKLKKKKFQEIIQDNSVLQMTPNRIKQIKIKSERFGMILLIIIINVVE